MENVSKEDSLHDISKPVFWENNKKKKKKKKKNKKKKQQQQKKKQSVVFLIYPETGEC